MRLGGGVRDLRGLLHHGNKRRASEILFLVDRCHRGSRFNSIFCPEDYQKKLKRNMYELAAEALLINSNLEGNSGPNVGTKSVAKECD